MRIALVEDNVLAARTMERQLRKLGHATERITDVGTLLAGGTELEPDLIITDIFMPGVEGLELIRMLKASALAHIPIIAISGGGSYMGASPMSRTASSPRPRWPLARRNSCASRSPSRPCARP